MPKKTKEKAVAVEPHDPQFGDEGDAVKEIQQLLGKWHKLHEHYHTGLFDSATRDAVVAFQEGQGYPATGIVDGKTLNALRGERDHAAEEAAIEAAKPKVEEEDPAE